MEYQIRPVRHDDLPELLVLMSEHAAYEKVPFTADGKSARLLRALFESPVRLFCEVVEKQNQLIGFVSYTYDFSTWDAAEFMYMDCLFLREQSRGYGYRSRDIIEIATHCPGKRLQQYSVANARFQ